MNPSHLPPVPGPRTVHRLSADGAIRDWLVSPVWDTPCTDLGQVVRADGHPWDEGDRLGRWRLTQGPDVAPVKDALYAVRPLCVPSHLPEVVEGGELTWPAPWDGELHGDWARWRTQDDGVLERSIFCYTPTSRVFLAATVLEVDQPEVRRLVVRCTGPLQLWAGGKLVLDHAEFGYMQPWTREVELLLPSGTTELVLASWNVALREVRQFVSVHVDGLPVRVALPSPGADPLRDTVAQQVLDGVGIRRWETDGETFTLHGPPGARLAVTIADHPVDPVTIGSEGTVDIAIPRADGDSSQASMLGTGELTVRVRLDDPTCPSTRDLLIGHLPWRSRQQPEGAPEDWRHELLEHVTGRGGSASALATWALQPEGDGGAVTPESLATALRFVDDRCDCADFEAVGLMLLWHRVPEQRWAPGLRDRVQQALVDFKYWIDQPGLDAMCYFTENHQMVWHTAETLVGEAFPEAVFPNSGWTGAQHADHGREMARAWVNRKLTSGFSEFDSNAYLAIDALALVALVDHARDEDLRARAEALLDKILLSLASNSWRGTHGSAHGRSYTPTLRASVLEETAPIMWWAWGMGALNEAALPATALATSTAYVLPEAIRAIAHDADADWSGEQSYRGDYAFERDLLVRPYDSRVLVRRGPGGMVSSVQDYRVGLPGLQEHIWGITLPGHVQVWATNPNAANHGPHTRPSGWVGHRVLPRARQHNRTVIALHRSEGKSARTHLWFPVARMDQWREHGEWLVAQRDRGFVAVCAAGGFAPDQVGDEAWQRWVPRGDGCAYVAIHGDDRQGSFDDFVASLPEVTFRRDRPGATVAGASRLELDWEGPFLVDGVPADLEEGAVRVPPHLDNPSARVALDDTTMTASYAGHVLTLDLAGGRRVAPESGV